MSLINVAASFLTLRTSTPEELHGDTVVQFSTEMIQKTAGGPDESVVSSPRCQTVRCLKC